MINILVVDDHPSMGVGTKFTLEQQADIQADVITDSEKVADLLGNKRYDIYLVDLFMPNLNGVELTKEILRKDPEALVLIYTGYDIMIHYNLILNAGAVGFISKTATHDQLITAIRCALREEVVIPIRLLRQLKRVDAGPVTRIVSSDLSEMTLSGREQRILEQVGAGVKNIAIADSLNMSQRTIELGLTRIFEKLGVKSRTEAYKKALEYGLLSVGEIE